MGRTVSVFILSDNRLFRESLGRILSKRSDLKVASSQGFSEKACEEALRSASDVILLDSLEFLCAGVSGHESPEKSRKSTRMLLVAMEEDEQIFLRAIRAGAMGFVPKDASAQDVVTAVRSVARGEAVCPPRFCKFLFDCVASQVKDPSEDDARQNVVLTRREQQLVPMIGQGLTNKEIAQQLHLSEQTIKNHVHRILQKIGVDSRMGILAAVHHLPN
ncbi:MAG TPA: response regulator transcription factor [Candidatus Acidoferrales bacterium]|nr:response regulator transcription factor [Candidatus Acidoferrales bacterium]